MKRDQDQEKDQEKEKEQNHNGEQESKKDTKLLDSLPSSPCIIIRLCLNQLTEVINRCLSWQIFTYESRPLLFRSLSMVDNQLTHMHPSTVDSALRLATMIYQSISTYIHRVEDAVRLRPAQNRTQVDTLLVQCSQLQSTCESLITRLKAVFPSFQGLFSSVPSASNLGPQPIPLMRTEKIDVVADVLGGG